MYEGLPCVTREIPRGEFMVIEVSDYLGCPWPNGVTFDRNQLLTDLPCGVTTAAGTHPSTAKHFFV